MSSYRFSGPTPTTAPVGSSRPSSSIGQASSPFFGPSATTKPSISSNSITNRLNAQPLPGSDLQIFGQNPAPRSSLPRDSDDFGFPGPDEAASEVDEHDTLTAASYSRPRSRTTRSTTVRPGTCVTSYMGSESQSVVCALSEGRGISPSVGVASINLSLNEVILSQISENQTYYRTIHKVDLLKPSHVLFVSSSCPPHPKSTLYSFVEEHVANTKLVAFDRRHWVEATGLQYIQDLGMREDSEAVQVAVQGNFYTTCALAAVLKFVETELAISIKAQSLRIKYDPPEDTMLIDVSAIRSLELLQNLRSPRSKDCLYGLLNHTQTPMGSRLLRSTILQPSTQKDDVLVFRYDALAELTASEDVYADINKALRGFHDVERLLTRLVIVPHTPSLQESENAINHVIAVKTFLDGIPPVYQALLRTRSTLLAKIRDNCNPIKVAETRDLIAETIDDAIQISKTPLEMRNARMFAVKAGVCGLLDVSRKTYAECTKDVTNYVHSLQAEFEIETNLKYDNNRGYWIQLRATAFEDREIPHVFVNRVKKKGFIECMTVHLKKLNARLHDSVIEAIQLGDKIIQQLVDSIRTQIQNLFRVCESIAFLDMMGSFAHATTIHDYVRPDLKDTLALQAARHPILDKTFADQLVPNDFFASQEYRFQIITGCNMSGKSTYIRTISLLQVMAQIGCFVPARFATFPIVHHVFARVETNDSIEANMSTFSLEMREMAFILRNIDHRSLAIIDELGRGTSTRDGLSVAIAMAEALIQSQAKVWFATHFTDIAEVLADRPGVLNLHLDTRTCMTPNNLPHMTMLYTIKSGRVSDEHYGLNFAKAVDLPETFLRYAEEVSKNLCQQREAKKHGSEARKLIRRRKLILNLHEQLRQASSSGMDEASLGRYLGRLQEEFIARMEAIEDGHGEDGSVGREMGRASQSEIGAMETTGDAVVVDGEDVVVKQEVISDGEASLDEVSMNGGAT